MPRRRGNKTAAPATKKRRADSPEPSSPQPKTKKGRKSKDKSPSRENPESKDTSLAPRRSSRIATSSSSRQESDSKTYRRWPRQDPPIRYAEDIPESWNWHPNELDLDTK